MAEKQTTKQAGVPSKIDSRELLAGPPKTVSEYQACLVAQKKKMFKDPPILPLGSGAITFTAKHSKAPKLLKYFHPNGSPEQ